jgi:branched-chain amino acid transport system permease protein
MTAPGGVLAGLLLAALVAVPPFIGEYHVYLLSLTLLWGLFALSMGLVLGYVGQINFGQAAFVAIAAYASSLLRLKLGFSFWLAAPFALALVVGFAALVGLITLRLRGPFFALVTLALGEIVRLVITNWQALTNGPLGLRPIAPPEPVLGLRFDTKLGFYYLVLAALAICYAALARLIRARAGRMLVAVREDEVLAGFVGIPVLRHKVIGLCFSALVAGVGGLLIGPFLTVLAPTQFDLFASVDMVVMVVVGGIGTLAGPLLGAVFLVFVPEILSFAQEQRPIMMGGLLIVMTIFLPGGIVGLLRPIRRRIGFRRRAAAAARPI